MRAEKLIKLMVFFSWLAIIGLVVKTGTLLISYFQSINTPEAASNMYEGKNLLAYRNFSFLHYSSIVAYKVILFSIEIGIAYLVLSLLKRLNLKQPFQIEVQKYMQQISKSILFLWIIAMIHNTHMQFIGKKHGFELDLFSSDFVFLSVVIFIFAQIVKRGIAIQNENDLTI